MTSSRNITRGYYLSLKRLIELRVISCLLMTIFQTVQTKTVIFYRIKSNQTTKIYMHSKESMVTNQDNLKKHCWQNVGKSLLLAHWSVIPLILWTSFLLKMSRLKLGGRHFLFLAEKKRKRLIFSKCANVPVWSAVSKNLSIS